MVKDAHSDWRQKTGGSGSQWSHPQIGLKAKRMFRFENRQLAGFRYCELSRAYLTHLFDPAAIQWS